MSVTLSQTTSAAFPDRPDTGGHGLRVELSAGLSGQYLSWDCGAEQSIYHVRVMLNPSDAAGGALTIINGRSATGDQMFALRFDADARQVTCVLATSDQITADLPPTLD